MEYSGSLVASETVSDVQTDVEKLQGNVPRLNCC